MTKYRRNVFDGDAIDRLTKHFERVAGDFGATVVEANGASDHVHLLVEYPPKVSVSSLVRSLKGVSSRMLRQERPDIVGHYWKDMLWSPSYFAANCGAAPLSIIRQYAEQQKNQSEPRLISPRKCVGFAFVPLCGRRTWTGLYGAPGKADARTVKK